VLVTDLFCEPGCSGSPVVDVQNRVVGIIVGGTLEGRTLAIPIEDASALLAAHRVDA
jgi:S1-C subfamily serine protease